MTFRKALILTSYAVMVAMNALATILPINGQTTGAVSDAYFNLFAPAGFTFAIWGAIYLLLGLYVIRVMLDHSDAMDPKVQSSFVLSNLANVLWILTWHYDLIALSLLLMTILFLLLIRITQRLQCRTTLTAIAFFVYLGWLTVAYVANVTTLLVSRGFNPVNPGPATWTVFVILVAMIIIVLTGIHFRSFSYLLVGLWSFSGILVRHRHDFGGRHLDIIAVVIVALMTIFVTILFLLSLRIQKFKRHSD